MGKIKQIWSEMRSQPVIGAITVAGTALAIFLVMMVVMLNEVKVTPIPPESNRDRVLHEKHMHLRQLDGKDRGSSFLSYKMAEELYCNLESAETTTVYYPNTLRSTARVAGQPIVMVDVRRTDANYWKVFNHTFISGRPFTQKDAENSTNVVVISEDVARRLFGTTDVVGRELQINLFYKKTVVGVVRDVPTICNFAYASIWEPLSSWDYNNSDYFGDLMVTILARDKDNFPTIMDETERRKEIVNTRLKSEDILIADHIKPLVQGAILLARYSNVSPDYEGARRQQLMTYIILLLIPAINLSSMTHSRLRRRVGEIGVRRAFGCTRTRLIYMLLAENFVVTLVGGIIGLILSVLCGLLMADTLFVNHWFATTSTHVGLSHLLRWNTFLFALLFCFLLNLLSSAFPAWRASRINPANAIAGLQK